MEFPNVASPRPRMAPCKTTIEKLRAAALQKTLAAAAAAAAQQAAAEVALVSINNYMRK